MKSHTGDQKVTGEGEALSENLMVQLVWETANVLQETITIQGIDHILHYLAEPLEDGPFALRIQQYMASVSQKLLPQKVIQPALESSFLLHLNNLFIQEIQAGNFCIQTNPLDAVLSHYLLLHQKRTWEIAIQLAPCIGEDNELNQVVSRMDKLYGLLFKN